MPYLAKIMGIDVVQRGEKEEVGTSVWRGKRLERVYLDTSAV
jgi:hypothetical protein